MVWHQQLLPSHRQGLRRRLRSFCLSHRCACTGLTLCCQLAAHLAVPRTPVSVLALLAAVPGHAAHAAPPQRQRRIAGNRQLRAAHVAAAARRRQRTHAGCRLFAALCGHRREHAATRLLQCVVYVWHEERSHLGKLKSHAVLQPAGGRANGQKRSAQVIGCTHEGLQ